MKDEKLIILDCDDVLLDFLPGIYEHARLIGLDPDPSGPGSFDLSAWLGLTKQDCMDFIRSFNEGADTGFGNLQPISGAVEGVLALREAGYRLRIVSSFSDRPVALNRRHENLDRVFGSGIFEGIDALPLGGSKKEVLAQYPASPFVDDVLAHVRDAAALGHRGILMQAHHNGAEFQDFENIAVEKSLNWRHLLDILGVTPKISPSP